MLRFASTSVHPSAIVSEDAVLADDVVVGPYAVIEGATVLGRGTSVGAHALVAEHTTLGAGVAVFPHAAVGCIPQDRKFNGEVTATVIDDDAVIREHATIHRGTAASGTTFVGAGALVMTSVHVAHDCHVGAGAILASSAQLAGHVVVGERAIVGGLAALHQFVHIGAGAMVGGLAAVRGHVLPHTLVKGNDARAVGLNLTGLRRAGWTNPAIRALLAAYAYLSSSRPTPPLPAAPRH
ncbi:acyl-(Acyl-carrier-protein)-UDP-N-acetylglucosa mineO-acyltransferase [Thecamonas trahens ATCC 50062]|uniref:Acyl-(Acyl-carrier-protein)-UDP-N-acetylglucosa mineO-acyltransferase n=1 Tax=Thecamonas trahens ATCC 50062 TaxID=461836 RepID=A0A0L0DBN6_THETB|nr:acyl-(Acyl-carrier-protein)-UDP-N-acetylglucosa mineO-acyltransferase [Thecamonas trahens ATCC 50062]KNC49752.1 acyl-(Acyl-carrier-protein)-UDP-N-acetylglucosa mineO-acyltransferase [Thecamonas trahens ATCC 50062]|eukprot:XP_013757538.1 acyl-(Acyl-carrier-protein)-UDP-N-acetylglucosa mineO-acyltransferase [Thecamonas trahens ATCC 50062]